MRILHQPILSVLFSLIICCWSVSAQTVSVIHTFTGEADGGYPYAGLTFGGAGTLYGTANGGGVNDCSGSDCGVVFTMAQHNGAWVVAPLYAFTRFSRSYPYAPVAFGSGNLLHARPSALIIGYSTSGQSSVDALFHVGSLPVNVSATGGY